MAPFCHGYLTLCTSEVENGAKDMRGFLPAIVRELAPRDGFERVLAVQMATTHIALMRQGGRMANADQLPQFEAHERAYNKLARTYTAQVEALRKHRKGGKQTVTVQHVNVEDDGQAIVGNVEAGGRGTKRIGSPTGVGPVRRERGGCARAVQAGSSCRGRGS